MTKHDFRKCRVYVIFRPRNDLKIDEILISLRASLVAQLVENLPSVQETWVRSLNWEDPLEKEMATHSSILAWKISGTEEADGPLSMGLQRAGHD